MVNCNKKYEDENLQSALTKNTNMIENNGKKNHHLIAMLFAYRFRIIILLSRSLYEFYGSWAYVFIVLILIPYFVAGFS